MTARGVRHPVEDRVRHAPVERGLGMEPVSAGAEELVLRAPLHDGVRDDDGRPAPVLTALLADSGIGFLIFNAARLRAGAPTVELRIDHLDPPAPEATELVATLTLLHLDDEVGVGRAELRDDSGRAVAHAVATMAITGAPSRPDRLGGTRRDDGGRPAWFDPARLAPSNLEVGPDGDVVFVPGPSTTNLNGTAHGAVVAALARRAANRFVTGQGDDGPVRTLSETVDYLRPVPLDARVTARTGMVRSGRRFWTTRTEVVLPDGRVAARSVVNGTRRVP